MQFFCGSDIVVAAVPVSIQIAFVSHQANRMRSGAQGMVMLGDHFQ